MMHDLNGFQRDCLYVIASLDRPQGTDIKEQLDRYYGADINLPRLYPALDALAEEGYIDKGKKNSRANVYTLTHRGKTAIANRREWEDQIIEVHPEPIPTP